MAPARPIAQGDRLLVYNKGANVQLSNNFRSGEFDDPLEDETNHFTLISPFLMVAIQQIRETIGKPVTITSGFRCQKKNIRAYRYGADPRYYQTIKKRA